MSGGMSGGMRDEGMGVVIIFWAAGGGQEVWVWVGFEGLRV